MKKCSKCGTEMFPNREVIMTSYPPMYAYTCPNCHNIEYGVCSEDNFDEQEEDLEKCTDWNIFRNWAAMLAMNGLIASGYRVEDVVAKRSVDYADALITELKK